MIALLQDSVVTLAALGAAFVLIRNTIGMFRPAKTGSACGTCGTCAPQQKSGATTAAPLRLVRKPGA